ncbi:MAG: tetratricopeptide repeat protein [Halieaceae bacterium]|mgnify:FL=1|nr:tetratricopeptide repeat protein [Halieaceae bacterium]MBT6264888.1 tetratricopeptide repeat protein [Halieaceae bacterium]
MTKQESLSVALGYMRENRPLRAEEQCRDFLVESPGCTDHIRLLANALTRQKRLAEAEDQIRFGLSIEPEFPQLHEDLGSVLAMQGDMEAAVASFEHAIALQPALPLVHKKLAQALHALGRQSEAGEALSTYMGGDEERRLVFEAVERLRNGDSDAATESFKAILRQYPSSVNAMRHLASCYLGKKVQLEDAEALVRRATQLAPGFAGAWMTLASVLLEKSNTIEAIKAYKEVTRLEPNNSESWAGLANALAVAMYPEESTEAFKHSLALNPNVPGVQMGYGHVLKTIGKQDEALKAYRAAIAGRADFGEVYWSMANLKIFNFEEEEVKEMLTQVERDDISESATVHFHFSLGKAYEDKKDFDKAWHHYQTGNQLKRESVEHEPLEMQSRFDAIKETFTADFLRERAGQGCDAQDPIFIVGLPRSGSTLVEQIIASHSQVEGTSELPIISSISASIGRYRTDGRFFPEAVQDLRAKDLRAYGQQYLEEAERHRVLKRPLFTDKLPNNYPFVGLIHLILPNAKIINARRHPFDSCLGGYKQLFAQGQNFTYDMLDLAHYYQQYHEMMNHWHEVLPGKVLDVHYEETVSDLEGQVRRILDHCGLPFEESCLRFFENDRAVKTASSEQVRQPIYKGALGTWRRYETHLALWQDQLGYIVDSLPETVRQAGL